MVDSAENTFFWIKLLAAVCALVATFGHRWIAVYIAACRLALKRIEKVVVPDGEFVKRPTIEVEFSSALKSVMHETVLLYGQRGSGKTAFIHYALNSRRGVFSIKISKKTADEASKEFIDEVSSKLDFFRSSQNRTFVEDVFSACPVPPIVVVSLETKCSGEVLEAVLVMCKILSYENSMRKIRTARFVVDLSGSRAAIDASINLEDLRCIGVHVGDFPCPEALLYVTERMPKSFKDQNRRESIARSVVECFDGRVLTLQRVCQAIQKGPPGDVAFVNTTIKKEQEMEERRALDGWTVFCKSLSTELGTDFEATALEDTVKLLLTGPRPFSKIISLLSRKSTDVPLTSRDLRLFNADAGYHPLAIDPFQTMLSLSGKAIETVLREKYNPTR